MIHRHHIPGRAMRYLLAKLCRDTDAELNLIREVGLDNPYGWYRIADELSDTVVAEIHAQVREHPHMNEAGFIRWFEHLNTGQLDADDDETAA